MKIQIINKGLLKITPDIYKDSRGYFYQSYNYLKYKQLIDIKFVQDNESCSRINTLRGLHFQDRPYKQSKLIRVIKGSILDFALDINKKSQTYKKLFCVYLDDKNKQQFFISNDYAHGFLSLEEETIINYKCDNYWDKNSEYSINILNYFEQINNYYKAYSNKALKLQECIISQKDKNSKGVLI